jgi:hypothetical protein
MKFKFLIFISILFICSCKPKELPTIMHIDKDEITMKVSHQTTETEMINFKNQVNEFGVQLDFSKSVFFDDGKLRILSFAVSFPTGQIGTASADLMNLQHKYHGFRYTPSGNVLLKTGEF